MKKTLTLLCAVMISLPIFAQNIFTAIETNDVAAAKYLLNSGINVNAKDVNGRTPLLNAITAGNDRIVKLLLEKNADVNVKDELGNTALILACQGGHTEEVFYFLSHLC